MKRSTIFVIALVVGMAVSGGSLAGVWALHRQQVRERQLVPPNPTVPAEGRYPTPHLAFLELLSREKPEVVFFGDSITDFYRYVPEVWQQHFGRFNPANFGVIFDRVENVLWRMRNGELDGYSAKAVVVEVGTNNLANNSSSEIAGGIDEIVATIRRKQPRAKILILTLLPRGDRPDDPIRLTVQSANIEIGRVEHGPDRVRLVDITHPFLNSSGTLDRKLLPDGLHPSPEGFRILAAEVERALTDVLQSGAAESRPVTHLRSVGTEKDTGP